MNGAYAQPLTAPPVFAGRQSRGDSKEYAQFAHEGLVVTHKVFGEGTVTSISGETATIHFPKIDGDKKFGIETAIDGGFLSVNAPDLSEKRKEYHPLIGRASFIKTQLKSAEKAFLPYAEYLE